MAILFGRTVASIATLLIFALTSAHALAQPRPRAAPPQLVERHATPEQVDRSIKRAQRFLLENLGANVDDPHHGGGFVGGGDVWVGTNALATYALVVSGIAPDDKRLAGTIARLRSAQTHSTYALGLRALLWMELREMKDHQLLVARDGKALLGGARKGDAGGMYSYFVNERDDKLLGMLRYDHSCSNYGTMGVWAAAEAGFDVPASYWKTVNSRWREHQLPEGSWGYTFEAGGGSPSMTAGGLVTLFISQQWVDRVTSGPDPRDPPRDKNIDTGITWLADQYENGGKPYTLFNIQRVGLNSGYKYFVKLDWYQTTVDDVIVRQQPDGSWDGSVLDTAWTLSFVALGRAPVAMNKLQYRTTPRVTNNDWEGWQQRKRDAANLAEWFGRKNKLHSNWQIVEPDMTIETLHDSPVLYLSGEKGFEFSSNQHDKFRRYVEEGGLILGNANGGSKEFADSFTRLGEQLFPQYAFRELPQEHPIYVDQRFNRSKWKRKLSLQGLSNGSREFMLLFPSADSARAWQQMKPSFDEREWTNGRDEDFELGANIISYSIERSKPRYRGETYIVEQRPDVATERELVVARLEYDGNWDPEPFGWEQLAHAMHNERKLELALATVKLGAGQLDARFPIAHLTGTGKLELTERQRQELKRYAYEGGLLIIDACGGSPEFAESAEAELQAIYGEPTKLLTTDHPLFSSALKIVDVQYRQTAQEKLKVELKMPRLRAIERDGKVVAILSPQDISTGLVGHPVDGIVGYRPDYATKLMINILVFASRPQK